MMIVSTISKRVPRYCEMVAHINKLLAFSPVSCGGGGPYKKQYPSLIWGKVECFCSGRATALCRAETLESSRSPGTTARGRVSRLVKAEAQEALFDYLHYTRSLSFTDAEYISRNCPCFVEHLMSEAGDDEDIKRSLRKYLRYNPINEYEPFLESLGLSAGKLSLFSLRDLMFLNDDHSLLDNFHVLCNYGIPRSNMGKMFHEAREIFGYGDGLLRSKLEAYESLGLDKSSIIKLVACSPSFLIGNVDTNFARVLEKFRKIGLQIDWIQRYLSADQSYDWKRIAGTLDFLDKVGYNEQQLHDLLTTNPALVLEVSGKKIYVVIGRLLKFGLKMDEVHSLFIQNSEILSSRSVKNLLRAMDILVDIRLDFEVIANIIFTHIGDLCSRPLKGRLTVCREFNVKNDALWKIIDDDPTKFLSMFSNLKIKLTTRVNARDPLNKSEKIAFLVRLGYVENTEEMVGALKQFRGRGDQLQERLDCLVQAGLDYNAVSNLVKQAPRLLNQSKDVLEKKIDYLVNYLGYPIESLVASPAFLAYDLDRIGRRFRMFLWMSDKGAVKSNLSVTTIVASSESRFLKHIVQKHPEGPAFWESLGKSSAPVTDC